MVYFNEPARAERVMALYRDSPALRLSLIQAARLFGMPVGECEIVLQQLVLAGRLFQTAAGSYGAMPTAEAPKSVLNTRRAR